MHAFTLPIFRSTSVRSTFFTEFPDHICFDRLSDIHEQIEVFGQWFRQITPAISEAYHYFSKKFNLSLLDIESATDLVGRMWLFLKKKIFRLNQQDENPLNDCVGLPFPKDWNPQYNWCGWLHNTCRNYIVSALKKHAKEKEKEQTIELYEKSTVYIQNCVEDFTYSNTTELIDKEAIDAWYKEMLLYITIALMEIEGNKNTSNFVYKFVQLHSSLSNNDTKYLYPIYDLHQISRIRNYIDENENYLEHDCGAKEETSHNLKKLAFLLYGKKLPQNAYLESAAAKTDINTLTKQKNRQGEIIERYLLLSLLLLPCPMDVEMWVWNKSKVGLATSLGVDITKIEDRPTQSDNYLHMLISYIFNILPTQKTMQKKRMLMWQELSTRLQRHFRKIV